MTYIPLKHNQITINIPPKAINIRTFSEKSQIRMSLAENILKLEYAT